MAPHSASVRTPARQLAVGGQGPRHLMSVIVEDFFQVGAFRKHIEPQQWDRFESRLFRNTRSALDLLARYDTKATFFLLGWNAQRWPELVRLIAREGHEVASGRYHHDNVRAMERSEFCDRRQQAREAIETAACQPVLGYRMAEGWLTPDDQWLLDHLAEQGYAYDSSLLPRGRQWRAQPGRRFAHRQETESGNLWELPPSSLRLPLVNLPIAGGNYFRQIPHTLMKNVIARWDRTQAHPLMLYFHVWELDTEQPEVSAADRLTHVRHYRNLGKMQWVIADYLTRYRFGSVAEYLQLHDADLWHARYKVRVSATQHHRPIRTRGAARHQTEIVLSADAQPVTVVVPCFNEEQTVPYLAKALESLRTHLAPEYCVRFVLVDDGSVDRTSQLLTERWSDLPDVTIVRHGQNLGVARAILTGIKAADTDVVCSMDCDCSYDPHKLKEMIPLLTASVDLVTASPYHPAGEVKNVPGWRLLLSRGASMLYRLVLGGHLATYTSCFRVYRRESVAGLAIEHGNFLGIAELIGKLLLEGGTVVEYPATLSVRLFGHSKMKTLRTICGHLNLLRQLLWMRLRSRDHTFPSRSPSTPLPSVTIRSTSVVRTPSV